MKPIICICNTHDWTIVVYCPERDKVIIVDACKIRKDKHYWPLKHGSPSNDKIIKTALDVLENQYGIQNDFSTVLVKHNDYTGRQAPCWDVGAIKADNIVDVTTSPDMRHHMAHIFCGYSQSPFDKTVCLSFDGGGDDTECAIALIDNGHMQRFINLPYCLSRIYVMVGQTTSMRELRRTDAIDISGKLMGLAAYGKVDEQAKNSLKQLMYYGDTPYTLVIRKDKYRERFEQVEQAIAHVKSDEDRAATVQAAFEETVIQIIREHCYPWLQEGNNNLILTGGSALNINTNQLIRETFDIDTYIPSNPEDSGISLGVLMRYLYLNNIVPAGKKYNTDNSGMFLLGDVDSVCTDDNIVQIGDVVNMIRDGKILGLITGSVEVGPRALGRRSILCDPSFPEMKDVINRKVKHREWFRPFAPVCRLEDVETYFDSNRYDDLQYMSYAVKVRNKYKRRLPSITHEDGTARVQTVTKDQNELLYNILTEFGGVLLNTSLNVQGKPILNSVEEALLMVNDTGLDAIVINHKNKLHIIK